MQSPESIAAAVSLGLVQPFDIISSISDPLYAQAFQILLADATNEPSQDSAMSSDPSIDDGQTFAINISTEKKRDNSEQVEKSDDSMMADNETSIDSMLDPLLFSSDFERDVSFGDSSFTDSSFTNSSFLLSMHDSSFSFDEPLVSSWNLFTFEMRLPKAEEPKDVEQSLTFDPEVINGGTTKMGDINPSLVSSPSPTTSQLSLQIGTSSSATSQSGQHQSPQCGERHNAIPGGKGKGKSKKTPSISSLQTPPNTPKKRKASTQPESPARAQARYEANLAKIAQSRRELLDANQLILSQMPTATPGDVILPPRDYRLWERRFKAESGSYVSEASFRSSTAATLIPIEFEVVDVPVAETAKKHPELDKDTNISFGNPRYARTIPTLQRIDLNKYRNLPLFTSLGQQVFVKPAEYDRAMARKTFADVLRTQITFAC